MTRGEAERIEKRIDRRFVKRLAEKITEEDLEKAAQRADEIVKRFEGGGRLGRFIRDGRLLVSIVRDYWRGDYREIPYLSLAAIVFTLLYVLNPLDLIPDAIPGVGLVDDAAVVAVCLALVEQDLHDYRAWKERQGEADAEGGADGETEAAA